MSRAEKFIQDCTRTCSNELIAVESRAGKEVVSYHEWLTPDQARRAAEIAREEIYEWLQENAYKYSTVGIYTDAMITDLKKHLEGKK
jgi:hypothetical protein